MPTGAVIVLFNLLQDRVAAYEIYPRRLNSRYLLFQVVPLYIWTLRLRTNYGHACITNHQVAFAFSTCGLLLR